MKKYSLLLLLSVLSVSIYAQNDLLDISKGTRKIASDLMDVELKDTAYWSFPGLAGLNFSQTAFVDWAEGGQNSITGNAFLQLNANYKKKKLIWTNNFSAEYGMFYSEANTSYNWRKNSDKLVLTSNLGYHAAKKWYYSALIDFKTQFSRGYDYPTDTTRNYISGFMVPGYLISSVGMKYAPNKYVSVYMSPTTARFIFVCDTDTTLTDKYGVERGKQLKAEFGAYTSVLNNFDIMKNVNLNNKLELFSAYDTFGNVVINWELMLTMKVNKYINASVRTHLKYDDKVKSNKNVDGVMKPEGGPKVQFMDVIAVGFSYNF